MEEDIRAPHCFVCGRPEQEHEHFIDTEDGLMCPDCADEIDNFDDIEIVSTFNPMENLNANDI